MNTPQTQQAIKEEQDKQKRLELQLLYSEWCKHPVTTHLVKQVQDMCNNAAGRTMSMSITPTISDSQVRTPAIQMASYNQIYALLTNANTFLETIPTTK
jgi:hypothetical protein